MRYLLKIAASKIQSIDVGRVSIFVSLPKAIAIIMTVCLGLDPVAAIEHDSYTNFGHLGTETQHNICNMQHEIFLVANRILYVSVYQTSKTVAINCRW